MPFAPRLSSGDEIRCIAPARNATLPWVQAIRPAAIERLRREGLMPTFGASLAHHGPFDSSLLAARLADLHAAFADPQVKAIISLIGGYNSNQLLRHIDYDLIASNPKILCGYSDITALTHAIYARTALVTYSGPHFFNFGDLQGADYSIEFFKKCVMSSDPFVLEPSTRWSADLWANDQNNRSFIENDGPVILHEGEAEGVSIGGNLLAFMHLAGTSFWPGLDGAILFVEDYDGLTPQILDARLESLCSQVDFDGVRAVLFGRFHPMSRIDRTILAQIVHGKDAMARLPIVSDLDCGHTHPIFTFPVGGKVRVVAHSGSPVLTVLEH
jgi:muramoyltetrapeptide carboxypeptidase LdcA involved in peptidoglycan recycling